MDSHGEDSDSWLTLKCLYQLHWAAHLLNVSQKNVNVNWRVSCWFPKETCQIKCLNCEFIYLNLCCVQQWQKTEPFLLFVPGENPCMHFIFVDMCVVPCFSKHDPWSIQNPRCPCLKNSEQHMIYTPFFTLGIFFPKMFSRQLFRLDTGCTL